MASVELLIVALLNVFVGVLIIAYPKLLKYLVGGWFIVTGILALVSALA